MQQSFLNSSLSQMEKHAKTSCLPDKVKRRRWLPTFRIVTTAPISLTRVILDGEPFSCIAIKGQISWATKSAKMSFTFLNTTDAPNLSGASARQMRAHVTKANFKQRRQRLAMERLKRRRRSSTSQEQPDSSTMQDIGTVMVQDPCNQVHWHPTHHDYSIRFLFHEFRPLLFPAETGNSMSASESEWIALLRSEPALVEACMSVALEHWPGTRHRDWPWQACAHSCAAISMINSRLSAGHVGLTDGVIGAVFVLTFGERLAQNEDAVNIHLNGLSRMINQRRENGTYAIPSWFLDLLLYDSIQESILSTPLRKEQILTALRKKDITTLGTLSHLSNGLSELRQMIEGFSDNLTPSSTVKDIECRISGLQQELRPLFDSNVLYIASMSRAINLFLLLSWPSESYVNYSWHANQLRDALSQPRVALCGSTSLTLWQYFVGGVGAASDPSVRGWYFSKLANMLRVMRVKNWESCSQVLGRAFIPDSILLIKFKALWEEIQKEFLSP